MNMLRGTIVCLLRQLDKLLSDDFGIRVINISVHQLHYGHLEIK